MAAAAAVRAWLLFAWSDSAFRWYHTVHGLDMMTHVRETILFAQGARGFSLYSLLAAVGHLLDGPDGMVGIQAVLGVATAGLVALAAWRLHGHRVAAVLAGLAAALYAPAAMYELFHLKETTYLFAATLSLTLLLEARHRHFAPGWTFAAGAAAMLPPMVRFPGLLWSGCALAWLALAIRQHDLCHLRREDGLRGFGARLLRHCARPFLGAALVVAVAAGFNAARGHRQLPFGSGPGIAFYLGGVVNPKTPPPTADGHAAMPTPPRPSSLSRKAIELVQAVEIPNNLNYYFIRANLPGLGLLPGPALLLPAAFAGTILLAATRRLGGGSVLVLLYAIAFAVPLLAFVPLARYRLVLLPCLCLWAVFPWVLSGWPTGGHPRHRAKLALAWLALLAAGHLLLTPRGFSREAPPLRLSDFLIHADACRHDARRIPELVAALRAAGYMDPHAAAPDALRYGHWLFAQGQFPAARELLDPYAAQVADTPLHVAHAIALLGCGELAAAAAVLEAVPPPHDDPEYHYQLGECRRLQGRPAEAAEAYRAGLALARNDTQRAILQDALGRIPEAPPPLPDH